jgi:Fe-S cluster assembly protein SufD
MPAFTPDASASLGGPSWLVGVRSAAAARLHGLTLPSETEEVWRYSGIDSFSLDPFTPAEVAGASASATAVVTARARSLAEAVGERSALVVTVNGTVVAVELEEGVASGLVRVGGAGPLATSDTPAPAAGPEPPGDAFGTLHDAFVTDVCTIDIEPGARLAPVAIVHLVIPADEGPAPAAFPAIAVRVGRQAQAGVVELSAGPATAHDGPALVVPRTTLEVGDGAHLSYANLQALGGGTTQIGFQASRVGRDATLRSLTVGLGGRYARVRTDSELAGPGGRSTLLAAYLGTGEQVHDFRTLQDHTAPHTESELLFTGAVADRARSVYSGLIRIRRGARRADARQTNNNLVLSEGAHADSVPNLDIDENDVRCSHASTVGPINEEQRYYLESRGIDPATAERLIVLGFFADMAGRAPFPGLAAWIEQAVADRLAGRLPAEQQQSGVPATAGTVADG